MEKLDWEEMTGRTYGRRAEYRGLVIKAIQDESPENPFESWDCEPPTAVYYDRDLNDYSDGDALSPFAGVSDGWISRNWRAIAAALGIDPAAHDAEARQSQRDYGGALADIRRDAFSEALEDLKPGGYRGAGGDYFEALEALWRLRGRAALHWTSRGYSQGDYAEGISVATPAWEKAAGAPPDSHERQLEAARDLYTAWAWGDVFGYVIETADGRDLDSCWGYYGGDLGESGLEESALDAAESILNRAARNRADKLKELIRNRVPVALRPALLADAGKLESSFA
jgi:hypothetical protein